MLKKILITTVIFITLISCSLDDDSNSNLSLDTLPIKSYKVPDFFVFETVDTIKVVYELPDQCHTFYELFYEYEGTARKIAINTLVNDSGNCKQAVKEQKFSFPIQVRQREDYILKFWKGKDTKGNNIFEEVVVPVKLKP